MIAESQSKVANMSSKLKANSKSVYIPSKRLRRSPSVKKAESTNLVGLSL
jgi:hypothetical protein